MTPSTTAAIAAIRAKAQAVPEPAKGSEADNARKSQATKLAHKVGRLVRGPSVKLGKAQP